MVGSDAAKLHPSLDHKMSTEAVHEAVLMTSIEWEDRDMQEQAKYIAVYMTEEEHVKFKVETLIPRRKSTNGIKPDINGEEVVTGVTKSRESSCQATDTIPTAVRV